ncbi:short-chain dehydrogenase [Mycena floridula]|nr:short-chain dehydrogenase [Mycena floridula]
MSAPAGVNNTVVEEPYPEEKWDIARMPDLSGKIAIVTGANSATGLGFHIAHQLAIKAARVYVGARNLDKSLQAIEEMRDLSPGTALDLRPLVMDLGNFKQVQKAAETLLGTETRLDILVNSAALVSNFVKDQYGISQTFSINHLGPFLFTTKVLPLIKQAAKFNPGARIVNISSRGHEFAPAGARFLTVEDFNQTLGGTDDYASSLNRYGLEKLANILFAKELDRRFQVEGVEAVAISLFIQVSSKQAHGSLKVLGEGDVMATAITPFEGSLTPLFAATDPIVWEESERYGGAFLLPFGNITEPSENAQNAELPRELWETSEMVLEKALSL